MRATQSINATYMNTSRAGSILLPKYFESKPSHATSSPFYTIPNEPKPLHIHISFKHVAITIFTLLFSHNIAVNEMSCAQVQYEQVLPLPTVYIMLFMCYMHSVSFTWIFLRHIRLPIENFFIGEMTLPLLLHAGRHSF